MSRITYVGTRKTRDARYTPAARQGMLDMADRELRRFMKPQKITEHWWIKQLGFQEVYITNGETPWATLRVMMTRNSDEGQGKGTRFVRFEHGFVARSKFDQNSKWYRREYGPPIISKRKPSVKKQGNMIVCTSSCQSCGNKNDHVFYEAA